ncbi:MAG: hypothetical protein N3B10_14055 [Armatimonadetes bacterium]|nr:hypothetical protein [Armatimonadota bacterium]
MSRIRRVGLTPDRKFRFGRSLTLPMEQKWEGELPSEPNSEGWANARPKISVRQEPHPPNGTKMGGRTSQ